MDIITQQETSLTIDQALHQAIAHHQAGRLPDAEHLYRAILRVQPQHTDANHNLGVLAVQVGKPEMALPHFKAALEANPAQGQYWLSAIDALIKSGQLDKAQQVLAKGRQHGLQGNALDALAGRLEATMHRSDYTPAIEHREAGRYSAAAKWLQTWLAAHPRDADGYAHLAHVLSINKQNESAWEALNTGLSINSTSPIIQRNYARLLLKQNMLAEALQAAHTAYQSDMTDPENQLVFSAALAANNQSGQAFQLLASILQCHPNYADAYANRALLKLKARDLAGSLADCEKALAIKPHLGQLWGIVASLRYQSNNLPGAIVALEKALEFDRNNVNHLINLGEFRRQAGNIETAIALLEKAVVLAPNSAYALASLGIVYQHAQQISEAKAAYVRSLEIDSAQYDVFSNLGSIALKEHQYEEAIKHIKNALALNPNHQEALLNLGYIYLSSGDMEQAQIIYKKTIEIGFGHFKLKAAVWLAVIYFLKNNFGECKNVLPSVTQIADSNVAKDKAVIGYWHLLTQLLTRSQQLNDIFSPENRNIIYVIGESHSLSTHHTIVQYRGKESMCVAHLIPGCKQWHLGSECMNLFKRTFELFISKLPTSSIILLTIGEIDCRRDEGIIVTSKTSENKNIKELICATVSAYILYVKLLAKQYDHQIIICGVPAPNIKLGTMSIEDAKEFTYLIQAFNNELKSEAIAAGMDFLDVYALTNQGRGVASGYWHIDSYHLLPSAIVESFANYCSRS